VDVETLSVDAQVLERFIEGLGRDEHSPWMRLAATR
jgi:hypothetical protein